MVHNLKIAESRVFILEAFRLTLFKRIRILLKSVRRKASRMNTLLSAVLRRVFERRRRLIGRTIIVHEIESTKMQRSVGMM